MLGTGLRALACEMRCTDASSLDERGATRSQSSSEKREVEARGWAMPV